MEICIINKEKGYLWPFDKLCYECSTRIRLENSHDLIKDTSDGQTKYYCICPTCKERHLVLEEQIPEEIRDSL